jgi:hypothetical protein
LSFLSQVRGALGDGAGVVGASNADSERDPNNQAKRLGAGVVGLSLKALPSVVDTPEPLPLPDLKNRPDGNGTGVWGVSGGGTGVHGESRAGTGVNGVINGVSSTGIGVHGSGSLFGTGVRGDSHKGRGVQGFSDTGHGVHGESNFVAGIFGESVFGRGGLFVSQKIAQLRLVPADSGFGQATLPAGETGDLYARSIPNTPAPKNRAELYFCLGKDPNGKSLWSL